MDQVKILHLWDKIHLLHAEKKQVAGRAVTILRFEVDANAMSAYLSMERWEQLVHSILNFTWGSLKMLWDWLRLVGQLNWALNIYPWLRLGLGGIYAKTAGKAQMWGRIKINKTVQQELAWFIEHVQRLSGLFFFKSMVWQEGDVGHSMLTIHVDASMWGLGIWFLSEKKGYQCPLPILHPTDTILFSEALVVCSAVHISEHFPGVTCLLIATDNTNTFDIFASLSTQPVYNPILILAVNILLHYNVNLRVVYILGPLNHIADALSQYQNDLVRKLVPAIQIENFTPECAGGGKKMILISMLSRQPPRVAWTLDCLNYEWSILLGLSIDSTTAAMCSSAMNSYFTFCKKHHLSIEPTTDSLSYYITYQTHFISPDSINSYLSSIVNQLKPYYSDVCKQWGSFLVKCTLKGAQRLCSKGVCCKKALSVCNLDTMWACLAGSTSFNDLLFKAQLSTGFAGLLWLGELVENNKPALQDWKKITMWHLLEWLPNAYVFLLPRHKGDLVFKGNHIVCQRTTGAPDLVCIMHKYIDVWDWLHPLHPQLWLWSDGSCMVDLPVPVFLPGY